MLNLPFLLYEFIKKPSRISEALGKKSPKSFTIIFVKTSEPQNASKLKELRIFITYGI